MKVLLVPDSMKDSLSAVEAVEVMSKAILAVFPLAEITSCPLSDGGEGLVEVLLASGCGERILIDAEDPLGRTITASLLKLSDGIFLVEMAQAAGLELLSEDERNPMYTSTRGVGQLIKNAISLGAHTIYVGLGGSATHDLGCGMAHALGVKFYTLEDREVFPVGASLQQISRVDPSALSVLKGIRFIGITDVNTLLLGTAGAAQMFAPQKGASEKEVEVLEFGAVKLIEVLQKTPLKTAEHLPGSGAAGGLGFGLVTFLRGNLLMGLEVVGRLISLDEKVMNTDIVVTLEGKTDQQTLQGKLPYSMALLAKNYHKKVILFTGSYDRSLVSNLKHVFDTVIPIQDKPMNREESVREVKILLENAVLRSFQLIKMGASLTKK